ncbi:MULTISPECIES: STAS domain-containing protein [unclassified Streptomyces]|uniref:STAS domain-containing protein n=1 Tax=unclassified Streptomyces TaxID=2593676 RepID=UPI0033AEE44F
MAPPSPPSLITVTSRRSGDRMVVVVRGAIDYESEDVLRRSLIGALGRSCRGIDLDLREVTFWDCSGLNVLLAVRRTALQDGKTVTIRAAGPVVERVCELTETLPLFAAAAER